MLDKNSNYVEEALGELVPSLALSKFQEGGKLILLLDGYFLENTETLPLLTYEFPSIG